MTDSPMRVETGVFGDAPFADRAVSEVYFARVVIPRSEFARLGLAEHEGWGAIPACFRWCHAAFGPGGARWALRLPPGGDAAILFAEAADAWAFLARWSNPTDGETGRSRVAGRPAVAAPPAARAAAARAAGSVRRSPRSRTRAV